MMANLEQMKRVRYVKPAKETKEVVGKTLGYIKDASKI